jgi:hypothetical protein
MNKKTRIDVLPRHSTVGAGSSTGSVLDCKTGSVLIENKRIYRIVTTGEAVTKVNDYNWEQKRKQKKRKKKKEVSTKILRHQMSSGRPKSITTPTTYVDLAHAATVMLVLFLLLPTSVHSLVTFYSSNRCQQQLRPYHYCRHDPQLRSLLQQQSTSYHHHYRPRYNSWRLLLADSSGSSSSRSKVELETETSSQANNNSPLLV